MKDNVTGIVLDIPPTVLQNIKDAERAIRDLETTSRQAAKKIKGHFDNTMVSGVNTFIQKVNAAQNRLNNLKMPTLDGSGISAAIAELSQAMATIDKSATTGSNRLTRIANAMTALQTANPDPQLFQNIADGITKIGNTSQQTIQNVSQLAQVMAQLAKDIRTVQQAQNAQNANTASAAQYNKLYKEQANIIREINRLKNLPTRTNEEEALLKRLRTRYAELTTEIFNLDKKRQTAASNLAKFRGQLNSATAFNTSTTTGAINYAKQAQSLNQLQAAYKNLKAVMATTNPDSSAWIQMNAVLGQTRTRIDEIKKSMGEFKSQASQVGDVAGQLKHTLAATFSISSITGYMNKLIETRAQFELQQVALRAILQDKQEADKIIQQVQQMALQSPFSIMQMTTFTKQLAAYRIEADKLVGTTKMLADVSAGLGVDMQRLILAYGQVKAANYLRACLGKGTRVKMFDGTFKNVEDIVVGDVLMGDDEQPRNVSKLYQGEQQMYRVSYLGGEFRCNEHHILTVYDALCDCVNDVFVTEVFNSSLVYRYQGVRRVDGKYEPFFMEVEKDTVDTYYGFSIDGNHRFIIEDNIVTHNTEVRQFTEAGLNIAGELANYFSELQGKMISVGDVMDMITKRMVRFEDVEEVFKRVTSAGGLFYDMQKKQSETLWGQLQRIKDAMSIMFNEIGKSNQGAISTMLTLIRSLINHWRMLAPIITTVGGVMATVLAVQGIKAFITSLRTMGTMVATLALKWRGVESAAAAAAVAERGASMATGIGLAVTAVTMLAGALIGAWQEAHKLNEEFDRISEESSKDMWDLIFKFQEGADAVRDQTKSYEERQKALEDLQNTFRGILPDQDLEYNNIIRITDGYKSVTEAIKAYSAEKAKQAAEEAINTEKQKQWTDFTEGSKDILAPLLSGAFMDLSGASEASLRGLVGNIMMKIQSEVESGAIKSGQAAYDRFMQELNTRFKGLKGAEYGNLQEALKGVFNVDNNSTAYIAAFQDLSILWKQNFADMLTYAQDKQQEFAAQYRTVNEGMSADDQKAFDNFKANYELRKKVLEDFQAALLAYQEARKNGDIDAKGNATNEAGQGRIADLGEVKGKLNHLLTVTGEAAISWQELKTNTENETDALVYFDDVQKTVLGSFLQNIINAGGNKSIVNWAEETNESLQNAGFQEMQLDIVDLSKEWAKFHGVSSATLTKLKIDANTNYTSAAKDAKALSDAAADNIKKITETIIYLRKLGYTAAQAQAEAEKQVGTTKEEAEKEKKFWDNLARSLGYYDKKEKKTKKKKSRAKDIWTPRLNLMQKVNKEYEKLLKYYSKEEAMARIRTSYGDAVAEAFKGTQWADISKWGGFDAQATIDRLKQLATKAGKDAKKKILEAVGTLQAELDIKIEEKKIQEAKDKIQSLFDNYELTKTFGGLGLNIDLTYLVGGRPVKLEDLRKQLEEQLSLWKATGGEEDTVKAYEDALRKVTDLENKAAVERLKNYQKYLLESMSERVQIELKAQQEIRKIRNDATLDNFSKEQAINNVRKKMQEDLTKYDFDQFKGSDVYLQTFKDLERASKTQLQYVINKLKELQAVNKNLSPMQVKAIAQEIKKAEEALGNQAAVTSVFSNLKKSIQYAKERNVLLDRQVQLQRQVEEQESAQSKEQKELYALTQQRDAIQDKSSQEWIDANKAVEEQRLRLTLINNILQTYKNLLKEVTDEISAGEKAWLDFQGAMGQMSQYLSATTDALNSISEGLDSMGLMSDSMRDGFESAAEILSGIDKTMKGLESIDITKPFSIISGVGQAIGGIFSTIGGFFGISDKKKERQIKRLQEKVEDLQKAYEKLQTAIEEAYAYDDYKAGYNQSLKNLEEQKQAIQEQINLENSKKKKDKEKLKEWNDALEDINEKEKELRNQFYDDWGSYSTDNLRSAGEEWVSAWLDAFKETGDGLDALKEKWDEFYQNMILKQAASAVMNKKLKRHIDAINSVLDIEGLSEMETSQRIKEIIEQAKGEAGMINQMLKDWFEALGIKGGQGELLLSDLQKGIQNITEPQAAAIEAYLNSMRFAVFEQNNILTKMLSAIQAQYGSNDNSPMLQEVRAIRSLVASIDDRLSRVIVQRSAVNTGYAVVVK